MKPLPFCAFLLVAGLFLSGCDMLHNQQYEVSGATANSPDEARLKTVLQGAADQSGLVVAPITPPPYRRAKRLLAPALEAEFGDRFSVPDYLIQTP